MSAFDFRLIGTSGYLCIFQPVRQHSTKNEVVVELMTEDA